MASRLFATAAEKTQPAALRRQALSLTQAAAPRIRHLLPQLNRLFLDWVLRLAAATAYSTLLQHMREELNRLKIPLPGICVDIIFLTILTAWLILSVIVSFVLTIAILPTLYPPPLCILLAVPQSAFMDIGQCVLICIQPYFHRSEFVFINPNSKGQCGYGESFTTTAGVSGEAAKQGGITNILGQNANLLVCSINSLEMIALGVVQ
ncbi:hypothetical protein CXB51_022602 [Gossypium anomalum]|uniref:Uncharacterized protein n=1 Tax=Gossypium anomalum TaxID=47600 RepID=A0A8J5YKP8_9ROSI|nr:hypothetical protein CXB51_022602 [Gossypium anomalum]